MVHLILATAVIIAFGKSRHSRKSLVPISMLLLTAFSVFRYKYGNDYSSYMNAYYNIRNDVLDPFENEFLFSYLNKIVPNFFILIAIISVFFLLVVNKIITENLRGIYASLAVLIFIINPYLFLMNLSALRQCIAMCIFIISIKYIKDRNIIKYILLILLASMFHTSALVLIPIYFFINDKCMNRGQTAILIISMIVLLVEGTLVTKFIETGLQILDNSDYTHHFSQDASNSLRATILTGISFVYVAINLVNLRGYKLIFGKLYLIGLAFGVISYYYAMFTRVQMYFDIFSIIVIPSILEYNIQNTINRWQRIVQVYIFPLIILMVYCARYYSFFANPMWNSFTTYHTIFEALL